MSASLLSQRDGPEWEIKELTPDGGDTAGVNLCRTLGLGGGGASSTSTMSARPRFKRGRKSASPCPLYPRKRTSADVNAMSAKCQQRTFRPPFAMSASLSIAGLAQASVTVQFSWRKFAVVWATSHTRSQRPIDYRQYESPCARL